MTAVRVAVGIILDQGRVFLQRRPLDAARCPGLWEFPGGKLESGETAMDALLRELQEELSWRPDQARPLPEQRHAYPDGVVRLHPFLCRGRDRPETGLAWGWFTPAQMERLPLPAANRALPGLLRLLSEPLK